MSKNKDTNKMPSGIFYDSGDNDVYPGESPGNHEENTNLVQGFLAAIYQPLPSREATQENTLAKIVWSAKKRDNSKTEYTIALIGEQDKIMSINTDGGTILNLFARAAVKGTYKTENQIETEAAFTLRRVLYIFGSSSYTDENKQVEYRVTMRKGTYKIVMTSQNKTDRHALRKEEDPVEFVTTLLHGLDEADKTSPTAKVTINDGVKATITTHPTEVIGERFASIPYSLLAKHSDPIDEELVELACYKADGDILKRETTVVYYIDREYEKGHDIILKVFMPKEEIYQAVRLKKIAKDYGTSNDMSAKTVLALRGLMNRCAFNYKNQSYESVFMLRTHNTKYQIRVACGDKSRHILQSGFSERVVEAGLLLDGMCQAYETNKPVEVELVEGVTASITKI